MSKVTAEVVRRFRDKVTGKIHEVGTDYIGTGSRVNELVKIGFVKVADTGPDLSNLTVAELKEKAKSKNIEIPSDITKKDDIVKFLTDAQ